MSKFAAVVAIAMAVVTSGTAFAQSSHRPGAPAQFYGYSAGQDPDAAVRFELQRDSGRGNS
jgi:hypothetical protein